MNWSKRIRNALTEPVPNLRPSALEAPLNNFTPRAQQVLAYSRSEADRLHHNFVGTEHLLLGLIRVGQGVAVNVLGKMGLDLEEVVIYRNALFKGVKKLFRGDGEALADFIELEQADGQKIFVAKYSVIKFCEPGTTPGAESVSDT